MDINKLLELVERQIDTEVADRKYSGKFRFPDSFADQGSQFSTGKPARTDPHMFKKHGTRPLGGDERKDYDDEGDAVFGQVDVDGYDVFVRYLVKHDIDNPHFPAVYKAHKITDKQGRHINKYDVEKLIPSDKLSPEELEHVLDTTFTERPPNEHHWSALNLLTSALSAVVKGSPRFNHGLALDSMKEAVTILGNIRREERLQWDIHSGNFMFRRTRNGLQLVFNDFFSFRA